MRYLGEGIEKIYTYVGIEVQRNIGKKENNELDEVENKNLAMKI